MLLTEGLYSIAGSVALAVTGLQPSTVAMCTCAPNVRAVENKFLLVGHQRVCSTKHATITSQHCAHMHGMGQWVIYVFFKVQAIYIRRHFPPFLHPNRRGPAHRFFLSLKGNPLFFCASRAFV